MPLLPLAAQVSDDKLQDRWAALLESASRGDDSFLPSFGHTLSQLTAEQAQFIEKYYKAVSRPHANDPRIRKHINFLYEVYDPEIVVGITQGEADYSLDELRKERVAEIKHWRHAKLIIDDIERLGIWNMESTQKGNWTSVQYSLTEYGISFIQAVSSNKEKLSAQSSE